MEVQYLILILMFVFMLFLIAIWINKTSKIFFWNYIAWFSVLIWNLFLDLIINYIPYLNVSNPDMIQWFIMNNKTFMILWIYFLIILLFYKSTLFEINIKSIMQKFYWFFIIQILTLINCTFTLMLIFNWTKILTLDWYMELIDSLEIKINYLLDFFKIIPIIIVIWPLFIFLIFIQANINIKMPNLKKKNTKIDHTPEVENTIE